MATLETQLIKAVQEENLDEVRSLIERGAKINISTSGRSPLSIAAHLGNIPMLELLLNSGRFSPQKECSGKINSNRRIKNKNSDVPTENPQQCENVRRFKRKRSSEEGAKGNNGYYVIIHEDETRACENVEECTLGDINKNSSLSIDEVATPEGMDNLEWDMEVKDGEESESDEEDLWSNQYRWYAKILANTYCPIVETPNVCDVNLQDSIGRCAIHYAAEYGHVNAVKLLINAGSRVDIGDVDSLTPLHLACNRGHYSVVEALITSGAMVNTKTTDKLSALHYAASRGFSDIVELLIKNGANVDSLDATDRTPLKLAVSRNLYDVAKTLVKYEARVNLEDVKGYTPLCEAVWQKSVCMAKLLLDAGAKLTPTPYLLHYAILHQHFEMVELLLKSGSLVNIRDNHGNTPLITAAITGQTAIIKLLLKYGAMVDCCGTSCEKTPLSAAISWKGKTCEDVIMTLLDGGADVDKECWNDSPLTLALTTGKFRIAGLLIGHGADVNKVVKHVVGYRDSMKVAIAHRNIKIIKMMVLAGYNLVEKWPKVAWPGSNCRLLSEIEAYLLWQKANPMTLAELCRLKIRSCRGKISMRKYVQQLQLPHMLAKYILMEEMLIYESEKQPLSKLLIFPFAEF